MFSFLLAAPPTGYCARMPDVHIVLDSGAWPPHNPRRLTLDAYAATILAWRQASGAYGALDWCAAYDHIGDPARTVRDYHALLALCADAGAAGCPFVPVIHYPQRAADTILRDMQQGHAGTRDDCTDGDGITPTRPCYALGGLVPALHPTQPRSRFAAADAWYARQLTELEQATDQIDPDLLRLHLFGVGRPAFFQRSPLVASFDSSGPAQLARFGWQKIRPTYQPVYGYPPHLLQRSRAARLAYWLAHYRASTGVPSHTLAACDLPLDTQQPAIIEHSLFDLLAN